MRALQRRADPRMVNFEDDSSDSDSRPQKKTKKLNSQTNTPAQLETFQLLRWKLIRLLRLDK